MSSVCALMTRTAFTRDVWSSPLPASPSLPLPPPAPPSQRGIRKAGTPATTACPYGTPPRLVAAEQSGNGRREATADATVLLGSGWFGKPALTTLGGSTSGQRCGGA